MFGYINVCKKELKIKEYDTFKAYYCGLCRALNNNYSAKARLLLSYDCAFLYLLSDAVLYNKPEYKKLNCIIHPFEKRFCTNGSGAEYASAINVILGALSLKDHSRDEKNILYNTAEAVMRSDLEKALNRYPEVSGKIITHLNNLSEIEKSSVCDLDLPSNEFAEILSAVMEQIDPGNIALNRLGRELGRWIYLIDALDDFDHDVKHNNYNPFVLKFGKKFTADVSESAVFNLNSSVNGAAQALDLLDLKLHKGIIENIIYLGLYEKLNFVLQRRKEENGSV